MKVYVSKVLEEILTPENMNLAYKRVKRNKGSHGIDGMEVEELLPYLKANGSKLIEDILTENYKPKAVRRVEIPKHDGGKRQLGIPTVIDRMVQQAIAQKLTPIFEPLFSETSYGFRPKRRSQQAIKKSQEYMNQGYTWVVDIDLEKYFDTVNHDKLMEIISKEIKDKRVLKLIGEYLRAGVMMNGVVVETVIGCPQGGPLSPLLSNIMLNELDKELEKRGHKFCRYADDSQIYVNSKRAAKRTMESVTQFIEEELKLKVNKTKSAIGRPWERKFLGFTFYRTMGETRIRVHPKSIKRLKDKIRYITSKNNAWSMEARFMKLKQVITGWVNYYKIADMKKQLQMLDEWTRRRLRMCYWKQWKKIKTKVNNLVKLGIPKYKAWEWANSRKGFWRVANSPILSRTFTNQKLEQLGYCSFIKVYTR